VNPLFWFATLPAAWIQGLIITGALAVLVWIYSGLKKAGLDIPIIEAALTPVKLALRIGSKQLHNTLKRLKRDPAPDPQGPADPWNYAAPGPPAMPSVKPKPSPQAGAFMVRVVIVREGNNIHLEKRTDTLNFISKYNNRFYTVSPGQIYEKNLDFIERALMRFQGLKKKYIILFWEDRPDPIEIPKGLVNPQVLARVRTSRVLGRALSEMFRGNIMDHKGLIFILILFGVIGVIVARVMGYI